MEPGFDTFIYTDCVPGQGLAGTAGLQFQARSPGADPAAERLIRDHLLYDPPAVWMRERRPVGSYPVSFAHLGNGIFATAAGRYLGTEANGTREGNQLTHCIVSRDPASYPAPLRPAQLFRAPFWKDRPAPSTSCAPLAAGWQPGSIGVEDARAFVNQHRDGSAMLASLLAGLSVVSTTGTRILFIAEDPDAVVHWIIAGTLLLPHRRSLEVGFKVFTTDPAKEVQPVVAVHTDWQSTSARVENDLGYVVFDLVRSQWSDIPVSDEVRWWAREFCAGDPYDVMDAIEAAAESGQPDPAAAMIGRAAVLGERLTLESANVMTTWLRDTPPTLLANYRGNLVDRLIDPVDQWPVETLRMLDDLARSGQVPADRAASVRVALIRAELSLAASSAEASPSKLPPLGRGQWTDAHQADAEDAVVAALRRARPAGFEAVLRVAQRVGLRVNLGAVGPSVEAFIEDWAAQLNRDHHIRAWPCGPELEDRLVDALNGRVPHDRAGRAAFARAWLPVIGHRLEAGQFDGPCHEAMLAVAVTAGAERRERLLQGVLHALAAMPPGDDAAGRIVSAFWREVQPTAKELTRLAERIPSSAAVDPRVFDAMTRRLTDGEFGRGDLDAAGALTERRVFIPPAPVADLLRADRSLRAACAALATPDVSALPGPISDLKRAPVAIVSARAAEVTLALVSLYHWKPAVSVLKTHPQLWPEYVRHLCKHVSNGAPARCATVAFLFSRSGITPPKLRRPLAKAVEVWLKTASDEQLDVATRSVEELADKVAIDLWRDEAKSVRGGGLFGLFGRRGKE
jgi:hypothetical protein